MQAFALWGGPVAWFLELNVGYVLAAAPCFSGDHRLVAPVASSMWTHTGLLAVLVLCVVTASLSLGVAWHGLRSSSLRQGRPPASGERFTALWGTALGAGFCIATLATAVGIVLLPRCGG